jgi:hypothetical protein
MPTALAHKHIEAERRLRLLVIRAVERIWHGLPGYDRANVDQWLTQVLPVVNAGQRTSVALTEGYLAQAMGRAPFGLDPHDLIGAGVRNGTPPEKVYERPFVTVWTALGKSVSYQDAVNSGLARATGSASMDVQLSMARTAQEVGRTDTQIQRFQRVADSGACDFCQEVDGAVLNSDDAMDLHSGCGCGIEPLEEAQPITPTPDGVEVSQHGELGGLLTSPDDHFTTEAQALG